MKRFSIGDYVYYSSQAGDTVPAKVVKSGAKRVLIDGDFPEGNRKAWVLPSKLELQEF